MQGSVANPRGFFLSGVGELYFGGENEGRSAISIFNPTPGDSVATEDDLSSSLLFYNRNYGDTNPDNTRFGMDRNGINYPHDVSDIIYNSTESNSHLEKLRRKLEED